MTIDSRPGLEMLGKADGILRALAKTRQLTAAEIAGEVREPTSSTYRLLTSLIALGYVEQGSRRGLFRLGATVLEVGSIVEDRLDIREASLPVLRNLRDTTDATGFLCVRRAERAVCVERLEGRSVRSLALGLGESLPLNRGAAPRALLAYLPASEQDAIIDILLTAEGTMLSKRTLPELRTALAQIRRDGYAVSDGDVTPGIAAVGAPVFNHRGELVGAISLSGLRPQILEAKGRIDLIKSAAAQVSAALGHERESR